MGNCAFNGNGEAADRRRMEIIRVVTYNGGVMELYPPITAECITNGFPGHVIYRSGDAFSRPLLHNEELVGGESYHLRPVNSPVVPSVVAPYRVSFDVHHGLWRRQQDHNNSEVVPNSGGGMWKVKLVISPAQLAEILSQESRTEALMESVRTVAMCGNGSASGSSVASSDQWSLASSRKGASESNMG